MCRGNNRHGRRLGSQGRAGNRTNRTDMRRRGVSRRVGAEMELRSEEDHPEEQRQDPDVFASSPHALGKMKLKRKKVVGSTR